MKRRTFLGAGAGLTVVSASATQAQSATTLMLGTDRAAAATSFAERVARTSGGQLQIDVREVGSADAPGLLQAVSGGNIDMFLTSQDAFVSNNPAFGLFSAMPGGMTASELESWIVAGDGAFMWELLMEEFGIKAYLAGDEGVQPIWSRNPVGSLDDLRSSTVGTTGLGKDLLTEMGASDVVDIAQTSDFGALDVVEGLSLSNLLSRGLIDDFPYMIAPSAARPSAAISLGVSNASWSGLTEAQQALLERCITAEHGAQRSANAHADLVASVEVAGRITSQPIPEDIWEAQIAAANVIAGTIFDEGGIGADVLDAYLYFLTDVAGWSEIGEKSYILGRNRVLAT